MGTFLENQLMAKLQKYKFSLQIYETTIHNSSLLLFYVRYFELTCVNEEMLFIKFLLTDTTGETIFNRVKRYFDEKHIPVDNLIQIATDGTGATVGKYKGFISRMKEVAPHITSIHCIIHRQHLAAKCLGGDMEESLHVAIGVINFIKSNALIDRLFQQFCEDEDYQTVVMHTEVRWLSKGKSLSRVVELWDKLILFLMEIASNDNSKKQKEKAQDLLTAASKSEIKSKIHYLADIFSQINELNLTLQGRTSNLLECADKIRSFVRKIDLWITHLQRQYFIFFLVFVINKTY